MPQFYRPQSSWGGAWGKRIPLQSGRTLPATLARLLMQLHGSSQVSPQSALGNESVRARAHTSGVQAVVCFAGVAQLVEHLFCKQVVAGSSPTASSAVGPRVMASGSHARGFRVLASFGLRSDAHALKCVPLRSSSKPRQNAELRARVIGGRPLGTAATVPCAPRRSASSLARAASLTTRETSESCPRGQREQAVNLPAFAYAGSNPALSTKRPRQAVGTNQGGHGFTASGRGRDRTMSAFAGVAQLVERQPSKLNVEGSSPFSRSILSARARIECDLSFGGSAPAPAEMNSAGPHPRFWGPSPKTFVFGSVSHHESKQAQTLGSARVASLVAVEAEASIGAERTFVREHRSAAEAKTPTKIATRRHRSLERHCHAHLAQMVEHVLGKDEVTSSILVVGSKP